jgi:hypothetical protein
MIVQGVLGTDCRPEHSEGLRGMWDAGDEHTVSESCQRVA